VFLALQLVGRIVNLRKKPPVTLGLMAAMTAIHLKPEILFLGVGGDTISRVCLKPDVIVDSFLSGTIDLKRIIFSAFVHGSDMHLYYNMASLLLKGVSLELSVGPMSFAGTVLFTLVVSHGLVVAVSWALLTFLSVSEPYYSCAVGFSAVLFGLKYILSRRSPEDSVRIMGIAFQARYTAWVELVLISCLVPNASFLGHLCGILAGVLHEHAL
ncbi:unnamed protein product, partial [Discosporangium mesarthrocarpum]